MQKIACFFLVACLAGFVTGCGDSGSKARDGGISCQNSEDCEAEYVCLNGACVKKPKCTDLDKDSYCDEREGCQECTDCNDNRATIHPGAEELCDSIDNDCDKEIDEECPCAAGEEKSCGTDVGVCRQGTMSCKNGQWEPCQGGLDPALDEICEDNLDNDCNGAVNDGCGCEPGNSRSCGFNLGECTPGVQVCETVGGEWYWSDCQSGTPPIEEICDDGLDNDCDGAIDNGCQCAEDTRRCGLNIGMCYAGVQHCRQGWWGSCEGARGPEDELCNGLDDDCDMLTDEGCDCLDGLYESCGIDSGECRMGTRHCLQGRWSDCEGAQGPVNELCDGKDNDCDDQVDEEFPNLRAYCEAGLGICTRPGIMVCNPADRTTTICNASAGQGFAELCNGLDDDCDGDIDEDFTGVGAGCSIGQGACFATGVIVCGATGDLVCNAPVINPVKERCDHIDNDCDGLTDENFPLGLPCTGGTGECFVSGNRVCTSDGNDTMCNATPKPPAPDEACNGLDDDCDGQTDEGWKQVCSTACGTGYRFCINGAPGSCSARIPAANDSYCDYFDNDCDGRTDEDVLNLGTTCQSGTGGCLSLGYIVCSDSGGTRCNAVAGTPQSEGTSYSDTCVDTVDNDCNGQTDGSDSACGCAARLSLKDMMPLNLVGGGLGMVIGLRRKRRRDEKREEGGGS